MLTHDVEQAYGVSRSQQVAELEEERGFRSAFGFVPRRYHTPEALRRSLVDRGFEVIVHDLRHDGRLFRSKQDFERQRANLRQFLDASPVRGFSSGSMHHNLSWIAELGLDYDISTYDVDPFEPQPCGLGRMFPLWVQSIAGEGGGFVELPYTLPQDFTLFVLHGNETNAVWKQKLDWIAENGGMALLKTHPDYMCFDKRDRAFDRYPATLYTDFLDYVLQRYSGDVWLARPSEVARFWRQLPQADRSGPAMIPLQATFCKACRAAHAAGWLWQYPFQTPRSELACSRVSSSAS